MENIQNVYSSALKRIALYTSAVFMGILLVGIFYGYCFFAGDCVEIGEERLAELLLNNEKCILILAAGTFSFGIIDAALLAVNAGSFGYVIGMAIHKYGPSCLLRIIPHAVLEIPAIILSGVAGFSIPIAIYVYKKNPVHATKHQTLCYVSLRAVAFFGIAVIVMALSCIIECRISMKIMI